jgi:hypothetical protein
MDASTSRTPLLRSNSHSPDDSRRRQAYLISYGGSDHNPYPPPLYAPTGLGSFTTVFLFSIFLLLILSSVLTIEAVFDVEQISFAVRRSLWPMTFRESSLNPRFLDSQVLRHWLSLLKTTLWSVKPGGGALTPLHRYQGPLLFHGKP